MNKSKLIICGDSFSIGIGCLDLVNEPFGSLLSHKLNRKLINLAKGSSTTLSIYLQAKYALDKLIEKDDLIIISNTSYDRVNWFPLDYEIKGNLSNTDVNYHQYPPYGKDSYWTLLPEHPMKNDRFYTGKMFTENYRGIIDYWETFKSKNITSGYYQRFEDEPIERIKTLYDYATTIHSDKIERLNCIGLLTMTHQMFKKHNIKHLILTHEVKEYLPYIDFENLANVSWGALSLKYPDPIKSFHTSSEGHKEAFKIILDKIRKNNWIDKIE